MEPEAVVAAVGVAEFALLGVVLAVGVVLAAEDDEAVGEVMAVAVVELAVAFVGVTAPVAASVAPFGKLAAIAAMVVSASAASHPGSFDNKELNISTWLTRLIICIKERSNEKRQKRIEGRRQQQI